ncbi:MAG: PKD domain-containing protein [Candidatus Peribacter sp.]|nr:PKD domain-containing protein [Candidatus Peribacter sp.]
MDRPSTLQRLGIGILLSLLCCIAPALAIEQDQPFLMESWTLAPGSVFEILAVPDASDRQIAWSLTKGDGSFVQADRGPLFRERFAEAGDFLLRGEVTAADQTPITQRTFAIHIVPGTPVPATGSGESFIETNPPFDANGIAVIGTDLQTILVRTQPGAVQSSIDVNGSVDANGDGDAANDNDSRGTFFEADGSALRLWFTDGMTQRTLTVRGNGPGGPVTQTIRLYAGSAPVQTPEQNPIPSPSGLENVHIEDRGNGTFAFSVDASALSTEGRAILLYWDFGDGQQSMLDRPVHTYAQNGQYTIMLQARDLATTEEVLRITGLLPVENVKPAEQSSGAQVSSAVSSASSSAPAVASRFNLRSIATIGGGLLLAILVGFAAVTLVGKLVQRKLDQEPPAPPKGRPTKKSPPSAGFPSLDQAAPLSVTTDAAPPMPVIDVSPAPHVEEEPETPTAEPLPAKEAIETGPAKLSELTFQEEEAPSWLKQGHDEAEKRGQTVSTALPAPEVPKQEVETPAKPAGRENRPLPPWLEPAAPDIVETPVPPPAPVTPPPAPAPVAPPAPPSASAPEPAPVMAPAPAPVPVTPPPAPVTPPPPAAPSAPPPAPVQKTAAATPLPPTEEKKELSEAERERRRKKRARYRANKKSREDAAEQTETPQAPSPAVEPKPAPPKPAESARVKKTEPAPPPLPEPLPAKKASSSAKATEDKPEDREETDAPIAIIRADNISQDQKNKKKS